MGFDKSIEKIYFKGFQKRGDLTEFFLFNRIAHLVPVSGHNGLQNGLFPSFKDVNQGRMLFGEDGHEIGPQTNKKRTNKVQLVLLIFFRKHRDIKSIEPHGSNFDDLHLMASKNFGNGCFGKMPKVPRNIVGGPMGFIIFGIKGFEIGNGDDQYPIFFQKLNQCFYLFFQIFQMLQHMPKCNCLKFLS